MSRYFCTLLDTNNLYPAASRIVAMSDSNRPRCAKIRLPPTLAVFRTNGTLGMCTLPQLSISAELCCTFIFLPFFQKGVVFFSYSELKELVAPIRSDASVMGRILYCTLSEVLNQRRKENWL